MVRATEHVPARWRNRVNARRLTTSAFVAALVVMPGVGTGTAQAATVISSRPATAITLGDRTGTGATPYSASTQTAPLEVVTQSLSPMRVGKKFSGRLLAEGGKAPYSWRISGGTLPTGLTFTARGALYGVPTVPGSTTVSFEVMDSTRPTPVTASANIVLDVLPAPLRITTAPLPRAATGSLYSVQFDAAGGVAPYSWKWWSGQLPPGLSLSSSGELSGTPTNRGTYQFKVQVSDSASPPVTVTSRFSIEVSTPALVIGTRSLPVATLGTPFLAQLSASGGLPPYTWSVESGQLPPGISLSTSGSLTGTPSATGTYHATIKVDDSSTTPISARFGYSFKVLPVPLTISTSALPPGTVGSPYSMTFDAAGGTSPYFWSLARGSLPEGVALSSDGVLSGTPTKAGTFRFSIRAKDSSAKQLAITRRFKLVVSPVPLLVSTTGLPVASLDNPYAAALATNGGTAPFTWTITSGSLPPGITMSSAGYITGITTDPGAFTFTVRVTDSSPTRQSASTTLTLLAGNGAANWSGYVYTGTFTEVAGTFVVPKTVGAAQGPSTTCPSVCPEVAQWVGVDGTTGTNVLQAGVMEEYAGGSTTITPFWEVSPGGVNTIPITVSAGDTITVTLFKAGLNTWAVTLDDDTTGQLFRGEQIYGGPGATADFVVEAPTSGSTVLPLASFSPATDFTNLQTVGSTSSSAAVVLVQGGVQVSTPSVKTSTGFAVAYGSIAPSPPQ